MARRWVSLKLQKAQADASDRWEMTCWNAEITTLPACLHKASSQLFNKARSSGLLPAMRSRRMRLTD